MATDRFSQPQYLIRRKIIRILGGAFHVYGLDGSLLFYSDMKRMKLREDIRIYTDESMTQEVLSIKARTILDISTTYDVVDSATQQKVGAIKRQGLKSILRDEWKLMNAMDQEIGIIREDSTLMALLRRFLSNLIPQSFHCEVNGNTVATFQQNFNPFVLKITVDFSGDRAGMLDRKLGLAAGILLSAIEGRQG
jgi:uncharacterized protein YxjI